MDEIDNLTFYILALLRFSGGLLCPGLWSIPFVARRISLGLFYFFANVAAMILTDITCTRITGRAFPKHSTLQKYMALFAFSAGYVLARLLYTG